VIESYIVKESVACFCGAWQLLPLDGKLHYCTVCGREVNEQYERYMAKRKKDAEEQLKAKNPSMVDEAKKQLADAAEKVMAAAAPLFPKNLAVPMDWPGNDEFQAKERWRRAQMDVDSMDDEFRKQYMNNADNIDVRVMQLGPDGSQTDVTGRINPAELDESQIENFEYQTPSSLIPRTRDGQVDRKRAMQMLSDLIANGGLRFPGQARRGLELQSPAQVKAMKEMEAALAESDKILEHWKE
jgi:hypothetical protein